jgi:hypothetical protein
MANWFYLAGSLCFAIGTAINMTGPRAVTLKDFGQYRTITPEEAARSHIPLTQNNAVQ